MQRADARCAEWPDIVTPLNWRLMFCHPTSGLCPRGVGGIGFRIALEVRFGKLCPGLAREAVTAGGHGNFFAPSDGIGWRVFRVCPIGPGSMGWTAGDRAVFAP